VAQVLTYIYQITGRKMPGGARRPTGRTDARPKAPVLTIDPELAEPRSGRGKPRGVEA
jgi:hypothetical protein